MFEYIHTCITEVKYFIMCYLIGEMDTQAILAASTYTILDIYEVLLLLHC